MNNNKILRKDIIESAEILFLKVGFLRFEILELSQKLNIDSDLIRSYFISKGGLLLSILSEFYVEVFSLNNSFAKINLSNELKRSIFLKVIIVHERKIKLFIRLTERHEIKYLDSYLLKLLARTIILHYRLFLSQFSFDDPDNISMRSAKCSYYQLFDRFKAIETKAPQ